MPTLTKPATTSPAATTVDDGDRSRCDGVIEATLEPQVARGRYGAAIRDHGEGSREVYEARQNLIEANIAGAIRKMREGGPPLRDEQVERLTALLDALLSEG